VLGYQVATAGVSSGNEFRVLFNGNVIFDNAAAIAGYGMFTFDHLLATGTSTTLEFEGRNGPAFDFLDNVSVTQNVPDAGSSALLLGLALVGLVLVRPTLFGWGRD